MKFVLYSLLSRVPILDVFHHRVPALDVLLRLDQQASSSSRYSIISGGSSRKFLGPDPWKVSTVDCQAPENTTVQQLAGNLHCKPKQSLHEANIAVQS